MRNPASTRRPFSRLLRLGAIGTLFALGAALAAPQGLAPDVERSARTQRLEYAGKITLSGVLQVYWVPSWPDGSTEQRTLFMRFFPDAQSLRSLPRIEETERPASQPTSIQIYRDAPLADGTFATEFPLETAVPLLDRLFPHVPSNFFRYKEGDAVAAVTLRMEHLSALIECDKRLFFGDFAAMEPSPTRRDPVQLRQEISSAESAADCGGIPPYLEIYQISGDAGRAELKAQPDEQAPGITVLDAGQPVLKLQTIDGDWVQVRVRRDGTLPHPTPSRDTTDGYLPLQHLIPVN
ncbi:hypothetical protein ACNQFN_04975 [Thauera butanivorans]|uniref:hypothetical protein n=1 Tax=Thauera butanivorans TaxID=86174 RepID=UPI003AB4E259